MWTKLIELIRTRDPRWRAERLSWAKHCGGLQAESNRLWTEALSERALPFSSPTWVAGRLAGSSSIRFVADFLVGRSNWRVLTLVVRLFCGFGAVIAFSRQGPLRWHGRETGLGSPQWED